MAKGFSVLLLELALQDTFAYCLGNIIFVIPLYLLTERLQKWIELDDGLHYTKEVKLC